MNLFKKTVIAASLSMLMSGIAQAGAVATSYVNLYDFSFTDSSDDTKLVVGEDLSFININNDGDTFASLNGVSDTNTGSETPDVDGLLIEHVCIGDCTYLEDSFSYLTSPDDAISTYALGDARLLGSSIDFIDPDTGDLVVTDNADAETLAEVSLAANGTGSSQGNNVGVDGTLTFIANQTMLVDLTFQWEMYLRAFLSNDVQGIAANATGDWGFTITDVTDSLILAEDSFFRTRGSSFSGVDSTFVSGIENESYSFEMLAGHNYSINVTQHSNANATLVPEPGVMALFGIGLIGFGVVSRRRKVTSL